MLTEKIGRVSAGRTLAVGAGRGLLWGITARIWMRLIAEDPEFTWGGTGYILGAATIFGLATGVAAVSRRNGWRSRYRRIASAVGGGSVVLIGMGAGSATLPTIILGGIALGRKHINLITRVLAFVLVGLTAVVIGSATSPILIAVVAAAAVLVIVGYRARLVLSLLALMPALAIIGSLLFDDGLPAWQRVVGAVLYVPLVAPLTIWFAQTVAEVPGQVEAAVPPQTATIG